LFLINVIEDPKLSYPQLPNRPHVIPGWNQADENLSPAILPSRLEPKLLLNGVQDSPAIHDPKPLKVPK